MIGGGWRVDKQGDKEEFVMLCKEVDQHLKFVKTHYLVYALTKEYVDSVEIKHGRTLTVSAVGSLSLTVLVDAQEDCKVVSQQVHPWLYRPQF
jgi:hypothetical protein